VQALRSGLALPDFWEMTPRETMLAIEAANWREREAEKRAIAQARLTALLVRAKRIPTLKQLLAGGPAKPLRGKELIKRRREFEEMSARAKDLDINKLMLERRKMKHE